MSAEHVQTKREIRERLTAAGINPRKRLGQHFLIDGNLMRRLVDAAEITPADTVLEVGGGTGALTDLLLRRAGRVICVELDPALHQILHERFAHANNLTLLHADVLHSKHRLDTAAAEALSAPRPPRTPAAPARGSPAQTASPARGTVKLVANLPYQVATPLVINLLVDFPQVTRMCFTVQREVGERLTAAPGTRAYGPLSILAHLTCSIELIARLPPEVFWPKPAVDSVMLRLDRLEEPALDQPDLAAFASFVRGVFDHRRKTLRAALTYVVEDPLRQRIADRFDAARRPENFAPDEWLEMFRITCG